MTDATRDLPPRRHEYLHSDELPPVAGVMEEPLTLWERIYGTGAIRKSVLLVLLALIWELYARWLGNPLLMPTFTSTMQAFMHSIGTGELLSKAANSIRLLVQGYVIGLVLALTLNILAIATRLGNDLLETLTSMFNPLPAIALLPLALLWFGLGDQSIIFVLIHSVLWAVALNTLSGFRSVSATLRMVGRNYGLGTLALVRRILIPAAFPSILTGLKIGWAFAWRTLIAAELVFGVSSGQGGLGWFIFQSKSNLDIPNVFAGLFTVILVGLVVENLLFRNIEAVTVRRWGMQH